MAKDYTVIPGSPLTVDCPKCGAKTGTRCRNYKGGGCAPHRERARAAAPAKLAATEGGRVVRDPTPQLRQGGLFDE